MNIRITQTIKLNRSQRSSLKKITAACGGYDAYGNDTGFPVFFAFLPGRTSPAGFLSGCHMLPDSTENSETVEISAAVRPQMRRLGVFTALLSEAALTAHHLYPDATLTGPLPQALQNSRLAKDFLYDELLMRCTCQGLLPPLVCPEGMSIRKMQAAVSEEPEGEEIWTLMRGEEEAARLTLSGTGGFFCISDVKVKEDLRRRGYGTLLLSSVLKALPSGADVVLQVRSNNKPALRLYQKTGFEISERLSFYRFDRLIQREDLSRPQ